MNTAANDANGERERNTRSTRGTRKRKKSCASCVPFPFPVRRAAQMAAALLLLFLPSILLAQGRRAPPRTPKDSAPIDLTGYWVAIVTEDWRFRMITPPRGD